MACLKYRLRAMKPLDKRTLIYYSAHLRTGHDTECSRIWYKVVYRRHYRIEHYASIEENHKIGQAAGIGHGDIDDCRSRRGLQRQCTDHLPGDPEWQAQSLSAQQGLSDQAGRSTSLVRGLGNHRARQERHEGVESIPIVYLVCTSNDDNNSASSQVARPVEADAAMDKPCLYSTLRLLVN
jgi:hypothetical protein